MKSQEPVLLACTSVRQQLEQILPPLTSAYWHSLVSIRTNLSGNLLHSPDHGNAVRIEHADAFDVISRNDEVVVLPGGPVVAEGHVLVVGEEELGICIRVCYSLANVATGLSYLCPHPSGRQFCKRCSGGCPWTWKHWSPRTSHLRRAREQRSSC